MNKNDGMAFKRSKKSSEGEVVAEEFKSTVEAKPRQLPDGSFESSLTKIVIGAKITETLVESLDFALGENILSFRLIYRLPSRTYRTEFILNGITTIKPNTYNGASTGMGYWKLLKASLKGKI